MAEQTRHLVNIDLSNLYHHPNNPRKDLGDLTELEESIRKNGVMQNLLIIPREHYADPEDMQPGINDITPYRGFYVLIGNRRMEAAKRALQEEPERASRSVPCKIITQIPLSSQIAIMLEENIQRSDLTITEQAQSFQMMLDLGSTVRDIQEKTGFSETTIYHRLNIAKLDADIVREKEEDDCFQLTFGDMYALEKVRDIGARNRILQKAKNGQDLRIRIENWEKDLQTEKNREYVRDWLMQNGVREAEREESAWGPYIQNVSTISISGFQEITPESLQEPLERLRKKLEEIESMENVFWKLQGSAVWVCEKKQESGEEQEQRAEEAERKRQQEEEREAIILREHELYEITKSGVGAIIRIHQAGHLAVSNISSQEERTGRLWELILKLAADASIGKAASMFMEMQAKTWNDATEQERNSYRKEVQTLPTDESMMLILINRITLQTTVKWDGTYNAEYGQALLEFYDLLSEYGFRRWEEYRDVLDGSSPWYKEEEDA